MTGEPRLHVGILTVSDRAAAGVYEDRGGPAVRDYVLEALAGRPDFTALVVPDDLGLISQALVELAEVRGCSLVITTGGTGPGERDVTPEATRAVCERELPGFGEAMRADSRARVPESVLARQTAGTRGSCLVVNVPGTPTAVRECLGSVFRAVPHCIALLGGPEVVLAESHRISHGHS